MQRTLVTHKDHLHHILSETLFCCCFYLSHRREQCHYRLCYDLIARDRPIRQTGQQTPALQMIIRACNHYYLRLNADHPSHTYQSNLGAVFSPI